MQSCKTWAACVVGRLGLGPCMRILITAGPTREALDPVRYLSNRSSGRMGYALAEAAVEAVKAPDPKPAAKASAPARSGSVASDNSSERRMKALKAKLGRMMMPMASPEHLANPDAGANENNKENRPTAGATTMDVGRGGIASMISSAMRNKPAEDAAAAAAGAAKVDSKSGSRRATQTTARHRIRR